MKVVFRDDKAGIAKLLVENADDIWHLSNIVTEDGGTIATMRTVRKVKTDFGGERSESDKVAVTLSISVEKAEYHPFSGALRISGKVASENDLVPKGAYHTFSVEPGETVKLEKRGGFSPLDWERVRKAREAQPKILILLIDRDEANFALVSGEGINWLSSFESSLPPKTEKGEYEASMKEYFSRVFSALENFSKRADSVIVAGPGNAKENFSDYAGNRAKFSLASASSATRAALKDLLEGEGKRILEETSIGRETGIVDSVFARLAKSPGRVSYGLAQVREASVKGAVESLVIAEGLIKKSRLEGNFPVLEEAIKSVEDSGGAVYVVSETHEAGQKIAGLGGVAAILRYELFPEGA